METLPSDYGNGKRGVGADPGRIVIGHFPVKAFSTIHNADRPFGPVIPGLIKIRASFGALNLSAIFKALR
jgi:hypothetical protein